MATINARTWQKHDIEANWLKATNFIPNAGEIIVYDKESIDGSTLLEGVVLPEGRTIPYIKPRIKIGDGIRQADGTIVGTLVSDLPFIEADIKVDTALSTTSENPVQNKVVTKALNNKIDKNPNSIKVGDSVYYTHIQNNEVAVYSDSDQGADAKLIPGELYLGACYGGQEANFRLKVGDDVSDDPIIESTERVNKAFKDYLNIPEAGIDPAGAADAALEAAKKYTDEELAAFDFIKVMDGLPTTGLPNKIYLVPKANSQTQDLFDEYIWVNNAWEWITTKQLSVDLTDYAKKSEIPAVNNGTLTIKQNGVSKGTFTANQNGNTTIELTDTNAVTSVAGKTGAVTLSKSDIAGLENVDNTADADKNVNSASYATSAYSATIANHASTSDNANTIAGYSISNLCTRLDHYIDLSDTAIYDVNLWYPVITNITLPSDGYHSLEVACQLNTNVPSWATHEAGFTANMKLLAKAGGWGTTDGQVICLDRSFRYCDQNPVGYTQLTNSSSHCLFLRGGGAYRVYTDYPTSWTIYTSSATISSETVSPQSYPYFYIVKSTIDANIEGNASNAGHADKATSLEGQDTITTAEGMNNFLTGNKLQYATFKLNENMEGLDFGSNDGMVLSIPWHENSYGAQLAFDDAGSNIAVRSKANSWDTWKKLIHTGNIGAQSVNYANSAGSATYDNNGNYIPDYYATKAQLNSLTATSTGTHSYSGEDFGTDLDVSYTASWIKYADGRYELTLTMPNFRIADNETWTTLPFNVRSAHATVTNPNSGITISLGGSDYIYFYGNFSGTGLTMKIEGLYA